MKRRCCSPPVIWQRNHLSWPLKRTLTTGSTEARRGHLGVRLCFAVYLCAPCGSGSSNDMPQELNYWLTTVRIPTPPAQPLPDRADVAIIGAGFTGLSAALALAKRGARVVVLESETIGWGASSRNGGMVLPGLKLGVNKLVSRYGRELTQRMYAASLETIDTVERIIKEENIACDFV